MEYNPDIHHRRSIRLKDYDYSQEGLYFITICVHDRKCIFGKIVVGVENFQPQQSQSIWQRNYYEHIIRDEQSYQRISD